MDQCLFCSIIEGKIPSYKVYEDSLFVAILDINPANPGHTILVPKIHVSSIMELSDQDMARFFIVARAISLAVLEFGAEGVNLIYSMGEAANQRVPHMLLQIIPRTKGDKFHFNVWEPKKFSEDEFKMHQQKLSALLSKSKTMQQVQQAPQMPQPKVQEVKKEKPERKKIYSIEPYRGGYWG